MRLPDFFKKRYSGMGCGRSFHGLAAITKAADVLVDFTHDMHLHPLADMAALGTHEQTVLYQAAKLCTFPAHDAENLMFKEKLPVGGILHVRGHSYIFHTLVFFRFYGGGVGGVVRPCPLFSWGRGKRCAGCCLRHMLSVRLQAAFPLSGFSVFGAVTFFSVFSAVCCFSASLAAFFSAFFISFILSSKRSCRF